MTKLLASDLASAYASGPEAVQGVLGRWLAEEVEVCHEPAEVTDGVYPAAVVLQALAQRVELFRKVLPDYAESARLSCEDDSVVVSLRVSGTPSQGGPIEVQGVDVLEVEEGRIVRMVSRFEAEQMAPLVRLLQG